MPYFVTAFMRGLWNLLFRKQKLDERSYVDNLTDPQSLAVLDSHRRQVGGGGGL